MITSKSESGIHLVEAWQSQWLSAIVTVLILYLPGPARLPDPEGRYDLSGDEWIKLSMNRSTLARVQE